MQSLIIDSPNGCRGRAATYNSCALRRLLEFVVALVAAILLVSVTVPLITRWVGGETQGGSVHTHRWPTPPHLTLGMVGVWFLVAFGIWIMMHAFRDKR
jgi:hypothetical protein